MIILIHIKANLVNLDDKRYDAVKSLQVDKGKIAKWYNKKVRFKTFQPDELVRKVILPLGTTSPELGKWSPTWEGPFKVHKVLSGGAYKLSSLKGKFIKDQSTENN